MNNQEYEQKKRECLEEFCKLHECETPHDHIVETFDFAFDRAYALGKQTETITQGQIEKAAQEHADELRVSSAIPGALVPMLHDIAKSSYLQGAQDFIGKHNLTSDAEGEEMLIVSRKKVQELYSSYCTERDEEEPGSNRSSLGGRIAMLQELFGSKCLPDEDSDSTEDASQSKCRFFIDGKCKHPVICAGCDSSDSAEAEYRPKPAEPKFKVGEHAMMKGRRVEIIGYSDHHPQIYRVHVFTENYQTDAKESDLEPYTEPKKEESERLQEESVKTLRIASEESHLRSLSQNIVDCDKQFDNILKGCFRNERRLNIAAMAMQGMLSNTTRFSSYEISDLVRISLNCADALIKKVEGGSDE